MARTVKTKIDHNTGKLVRSTGVTKASKVKKPQVADVKQRPRRYRPGTVALREIRAYQKSTGLLLRKLSFARLVREIGQDLKADLRFQRSALNLLQGESEVYLTSILERANDISINVGRKLTVKPPAFKIAAKIENDIRDACRATCGGMVHDRHIEGPCDMERADVYSAKGKKKEGVRAKSTPKKLAAGAGAEPEAAAGEEEEEEEAWVEEEEEEAEE